MANGPGASIIRGHTVTNITADVFSGTYKLVVNSAAYFVGMMKLWCTQ